jgi:hypothetical protein
MVGASSGVNAYFHYQTLHGRADDVSHNEPLTFILSALIKERRLPSRRFFASTAWKPSFLGRKGRRQEKEAIAVCTAADQKRAVVA